MPVYTNPTIDQEVSPKQIFYVDNKCAIFTCNGSPEGVILANTGSIALSDNGSVFKKTTDDVNTGWVELSSGTVSSPLNVSGTNPTINLIDTDVGDDDGVISMQTDVMSLGVVGGTLLQVRSNGQILGYERNFTPNTTTVGNVGAGIDTLHSFVLPANSLVVTGDYHKGIYSGFMANNVNTKRVLVDIGGVSTYAPSLQSFQNIQWGIEVYSIRLTATSLRVLVSVIWGSFLFPTGGALTAVGRVQRQLSDIAVADLSANPLTILVQGESGAAASDDVQQLLSLNSLCQI